MITLMSYDQMIKYHQGVSKKVTGFSKEQCQTEITDVRKSE